MGWKSKQGSWIDHYRRCSCEVNSYCFDSKLALMAGLKIGSNETTDVWSKQKNINIANGFLPLGWRPT